MGKAEPGVSIEPRPGQLPSLSPIVEIPIGIGEWYVREYSRSIVKTEDWQSVSLFDCTVTSTDSCGRTTTFNTKETIRGPTQKSKEVLSKSTYWMFGIDPTGYTVNIPIGEFE